ncbi:hypothetical protein [Thiohalocapsa sp. ML1]|uniref:hypothetical protein n=1 Tax=Thiohalocapsa sp. ML1 TaxID=1431688 RepID=UPI000732205B|nr:hypothetical protein [Thiohalocapsa sp. ML1]
MSHDQNFKNLIIDYPQQAVQFFAADEAAHVDQGVRIIPIREEQLKERLGDRFRELDTPLLVEWPDGRREALLLVLEEETDTSKFSIHRLAHYCLDLAELFKTDRVVPVAIFLRQGQRPEELILGGDRHRYLAFRYLACALADLPWQDWRDSDNIVARLNLPNMRYDHPNERVAVYALALRGLVQLEPDPEKRLKYADFVDIYADLTDAEREQYEREYPEETKTMQSFSTRMREEGKQIGIQIGEAAMLLLLLEDKFGPVPEQVRAQVEAANPESLLRWSRRVLRAESIEDVFRQPPPAA